MSEIDLVPGYYRARQQMKQHLRHALWVAGTLMALILAAVAALRYQNASLDDELRKLQYAKAISTQQRDNLEQLNERKQGLTQQHDLLSGLRSGAAAVEMLRTVDRAMSDSKVWFTNWTFRRAGTKAEAPDKGQLTGNYFVVVSKTRPAGEPETWKIETEMKIDGEALDHAALSNFVSRLVDQAEIQRVRVIRTETFLRDSRPMIRFTLDVLVAWGKQEARV